MRRRQFVQSVAGLSVSLGYLQLARGVAAQTPGGDVPVPPPPRNLTRGTDGSLLGAARTAGTLSPGITSNDAFYIVTKNAAGDPNIDASTWRMVIDGEVNSPVQLDYHVLRALPPADITKTLECISNFTSQCEQASFGCELISTATWRGARLSDVLGLAGSPTGNAAGLAVLSADEFSAGLPVEVAADPEALLVYEMNGQVLPREHGYPARLLIPGRYGMKNPKWVVGIRAMTQEYAGWYEQRNWNKDAIVHTMTRIDVPANNSSLAPGIQTIAGIAYAGARGIQAVEYSVDGGQTWQSVSLEAALDRDTWVRWQGSFSLPAGGQAVLVARAVDGSGALQTDAFSLPQPDGATGWSRVSVTASA
jgi:DMSO/TMAO reductase YedYZ molybdopterin-dependent catalytic subunit